MDRYFYLVETINGEKLMHLSGNVYVRDSEKRKEYCLSDWTFFYIKIDEVKELLGSDKFFDYVNERVDYLGNITKAEAEEFCQRYFKGMPGKELHISDITEDTPDGNYWFDADGKELAGCSDEVPARDWVMAICDAFEDVLEEYDVTIPSEDRSGNTEEARLFGELFDKLASAVTEILDRLVGDVKENPQSKFDFDRY